jgi:hypothetical protein
VVAKRNKQTGTPSTKFSGKKAKRSLPPWGLPVPARFKAAFGNVSGTSRRKATPAPELKGMNYQHNDPTQWPVEPDYVNHTRAPDPYGITDTVRTNYNAAIEHAYTRAKYQ